MEEESNIMNTIRIEQGYLEVTLKVINDKTLDGIIEYSVKIILFRKTNKSKSESN